MNLIFRFLGLFFTLKIISYLNYYFWSYFLKTKSNIIFLPGVFIHELSHAIGCFLTGAKIIKIKFFSSKGGYVKHKKAKLPFGQFIISFFPVFGGILTLYFLIYFFKIDLFFTEKDIFFINHKELITENLKNINFWIFIYLSASILISIIPSKKDFNNSAIATIVIFLLIFTLNYFDILTNQIIYFFSFIEEVFLIIINIGIIPLIFAIFFSLLKKIFNL